MNEGQQKFMNFIMDNAKEESKLQAHGLLVESFQNKQMEHLIQNI